MKSHRLHVNLGCLYSFLNLFVLFFLLLAFSSAARAADEPVRHTFAIGAHDFLLDGKPFQIRSGEIHPPRVPREYWRHRLQMAKAMGLNTVCIYVFWNLHEPSPGEFGWSGQADTAEFCRLAQQEGLWAIVRPGPYACAEWEMGGFPWWLLKQDNIKLRTRDPRYLEAAGRYLKEVGRVLGPLQVTRGGPIVMVQVENEYGYYGKDAEYMGLARQALVDAGFDVPLFACNQMVQLGGGYRPDIFDVVNFGSDAPNAFKALRKLRPQGPLMCGEFYPGFFDTWGSPHHVGNLPRFLTDLEFMLKGGASFNIYMAHGGTTFGLWTGADRPFKPDTSSYDFDAPISEAGWVTDKFVKIRDLIAKYLPPGETIPKPPAANPVISMDAVEAKQCAAVLANLPAAIADERPRLMEQYDQGFGCIVYRTQLPAGPAAVLDAAAVHDIGQVFVDGQHIGFLDRHSRASKVRLPERKQPAVLDIFVEAMGRINFGEEICDHKGLYAPVKLHNVDGRATELLGWRIFRLPLDGKMLAGLRFNAGKSIGPAFWRATVNVAQPGDTFLDMRPWGKGVAWVNGHCLGRFWNIGPQQTMYVPGTWLKSGQNEFIVLDLIGPQQPVVAGLVKPILDQLRPDLDFATKTHRGLGLRLKWVKPAHTGQFSAGAQMQEVKLLKPANGRFFCVESLNAHDGKPYAAIAELALLDESGNLLRNDDWTVAYVDSEERSREDGTAENALDGQSTTFWHTQWSDNSPNHPHCLVLDLGRSRAVAGFRYVPRQGADGVGGRIKDYRIYVGDKLLHE